MSAKSPTRRRPVECLLGLGANLGDRAGTLDRAVDSIASLEGVELLGVSSWHETCPVGGPAGQDKFLNGAARLSAAVPPDQLLAHFRAVETQGGRQRRERWGARTLDIDLLLYGDQVIDDAELGLQVPHPRMSFRPFVIRPAAEIAPGMRHPQLATTLSELQTRLTTGDDTVALVGSGDAERRVLAEALMAMNGRLEVLTGPQLSETPKLQVCLDEQSTPLPGTPTLWLPRDPTKRDAELRAAIECVWPE